MPLLKDTRQVRIKEMKQNVCFCSDNQSPEQLHEPIIHLRLKLLLNDLFDFVLGTI